MASATTIAKDFKSYLGLEPLGLHYTDSPPANARSVKTPGSGCIMPLVFAATKGKPVSFGPDSSGWPCSAFYLGFKDWIYQGIEKYLSHGTLPGRKCKRFVRTPAQAKQYLESFRLPAPSQGMAVFKPLRLFADEEPPEVAIFFADPDQLSGLVFLLHYDAPVADDRIVARFASACCSVSALPLRYAWSGERKAVWGFHDISARVRLPRDLATMAMPYFLLQELHPFLGKSFLTTKNWRTLARRSAKAAGKELTDENSPL